jgi:hypothetical protein
VGDGLLEHVQLIIPGRGIALDELDVAPSSQQPCRGTLSESSATLTDQVHQQGSFP